MKWALQIIAFSGAALAGSGVLAQEVSVDSVNIAPAKPFKPAKPRVPGDKALFTATIARPIQLDTDDVSAMIGHGYDPISGTILNMQCVVPNGPMFTMQQGATIPYKKKDVVTDQKSYAQVSSSSFSANVVIKAISLGVGTAHGSGTAMNSVDSYGRLFNRIATKGNKYLLVKWAPATGDAPSPLTLLRTDLPSFIQQCGTYFVKGVYSGQQLDTLTSFRIRQTSQSKSDATSVSVGVAKIFGASASFANAAADANQHSDAFIENSGRGALGVAIAAASSPPANPAAPAPGGAAPPAPAPAPAPPPSGGSGASAGASAEVPTDASGIKAELEYYENGFAKAVGALTQDQLDKSAQPLYIIIDHYQGNLLASADRVPIWADAVYAKIEAKIDTYNALVKVIADLQSALAPGPFPRLGVFFKNPTQKDPNDATKDDSTTTPSAHLAAAKLELQGFQDDVNDCEQLILDGIEKPGGKPAADLCEGYLKRHLKDDDVTKWALQRSFT